MQYGITNIISLIFGSDPNEIKFSWIQHMFNTKHSYRKHSVFSFMIPNVEHPIQMYVKKLF